MYDCVYICVYMTGPLKRGRGVYPEGGGVAAEHPFIVTVPAQIQSRLISRILHYPQAPIHYCTNVPVLYS
jgi:hypothetical protein